MAAKKKALSDNEILAKFKDEYMRSLSTLVHTLNPEVEAHKTIKTIVDSSIIELLGIEKDSWGNKWKVNCCNGFNRLSAVGKLLNTKVANTLEQYTETFTPPELTAAQKEAMSKYYLNELQQQLATIARKRAQDDAMAIANVILK